MDQYMSHVWQFAAAYPVWFTVAAVIILGFLTLVVILGVHDTLAGIRYSRKDEALASEMVRANLWKETMGALPGVITTAVADGVATAMLQMKEELWEGIREDLREDFTSTIENLLNDAQTLQALKSAMTQAVAEGNRRSEGR